MSHTRPLPRFQFIDLEQVMEAIVADDHLGFCLSCGAERGCCEPDARNYKCEECDALQVFGAQDLLFMMEGI